MMRCKVLVFRHRLHNNINHPISSWSPINTHTGLSTLVALSPPPPPPPLSFNNVRSRIIHGYYLKTLASVLNPHRSLSSSPTAIDVESLDPKSEDCNDDTHPPPVAKKLSIFRRHRERMAKQLLLEYDRTAFGGLLLHQQHPYHDELLPQSESSSVCGRESNDLVLPPNIIIKWSNRLRTTAGRARLFLYRPRKNEIMQQSSSFSQNDDHKLQMDPQKEEAPKIVDEPKLQSLRDIILSTRETAPPLPPGVRRVAVVELSTKVVDDEIRLQNTLLHELCHVAAWIVDGNIKPPHGPCFQKWVTIVTKAIQPTIPITTKHKFEIYYKYNWECINPSCSVTLLRRHNRRSIDIKRHVCGKCRGPLREVDHPLQMTQQTQQQQRVSSASDGTIHIAKDTIPTTTRRPLTEYHKFMKKHIKRMTKQLLLVEQQKWNLQQPSATKTRRKQPKISPQKVMKECAKLWQQYKKEKKKMDAEGSE